MGSCFAAAQLFHVHGVPISWFLVFDFTKNIKQLSDGIPGILNLLCTFLPKIITVWHNFAKLLYQ